MSSQITNKEFAQAFIDKWGGGNVKKEAGVGSLILKVAPKLKGLFSKGVAAAAPLGKGALGYAKATAKNKYLGVLANQAPGKATSGTWALMRGAGRSAFRYAPGQKMTVGNAAWKLPYGALNVNLGKTLNRAKLPVIGGYAAKGGYDVYKDLGEGAEKVRHNVELARAMGMDSGIVSDMNRYSTRAGMLQGWLRGNGMPEWMTGGKSQTARQRTLDSIIARAGDDMTGSAMANAYKGPLKLYEPLNPGGALAARATLTAAGKKITSGDNWRDRMMSELGKIWNSEGDVYSEMGDKPRGFVERVKSMSGGSGEWKEKEDRVRKKIDEYLNRGNTASNQ